MQDRDQDRERKRLTLSKPVFRPDAVRITEYAPGKPLPPNKSGQRVLRQFEKASIPGLVIQGGFNREHVMNLMHGTNLAPHDADCIGNARAIEPYDRKVKDPYLRIKKLARHLGTYGFSVQENVENDKDPLETLGDEQVVLTLRLLFEGMRVDLVAIDDFDLTLQEIGGLGSDSMSSWGSDRNGIFYGDKNSLKDCANFTFRSYNLTYPEVAWERYLKLNGTGYYEGRLSWEPDHHPVYGAAGISVGIHI